MLPAALDHSFTLAAIRLALADAVSIEDLGQVLTGLEKQLTSTEAGFQLSDGNRYGSAL